MTLAASPFLLLAESAQAQVGEPKAGPLMGNLKVGPAVGLDDDFGANRYGQYRTQFALELEIAYAVDRGENAYIGFNPQFQVNDLFAVINLTGTFQYDIEIKKVRGLYLYPKINAGVGIVPREPRDPAVYFTLQPEFGVKYNLYKNFHVLCEPLSFPLYIGSQFGAQYRFWLGLGFDV